VEKKFGFFRALAAVDLDAHSGETVLLLGSNGAGKTTFLRIAAGLLIPSDGTIEIHGHGSRENEEGVRGRIGFLSHNLGLYPDLTAEENLRFFARLYRVADGKERVAALLAEARLEAWRDEMVRGFSRGMMQRLALARVFLHEPDLLLLDEPFTGLDRTSVEILAGRLRRRREEGAAVVLASHRLEAAAPLGTRAVLLRSGSVAERVDLGPLGDAERVDRLGALLEEDA